MHPLIFTSFRSYMPVLEMWVKRGGSCFKKDTVNPNQILENLQERNDDFLNQEL